MDNKYLLSDRSTLLKTKLERLASNLNSSLLSTEFVTREALIAESVAVLNNFYKDLTEPSFSFDPIIAGDLPDPEYYNSIFQNILDDLIVLFTELENIESMSLANFNFIVTESNRLVGRLKSVSAKMGDFVLYATAPTDDTLFATDSFNNLDRVDWGSAWLSHPDKQCSISLEEGIVTLPVIANETRTVTVAEVKIEDFPGTSHNDSTKLTDSYTDTVFEVTSTSVGEEVLAPKLEMVFVLQDDEVVNRIRIDPFLGTDESITIDEIETSLDGDRYTSIFLEVPVGKDENLTVLSSSTSKFTGQGVFTFAPRQTRYVRVVLSKAATPLKLRGVGIESVQFAPQGELFTQTIRINDEIKQILLSATQYPVRDFTHGRIDYLVSPDGKEDWKPIQPKELTGTMGIYPNVPEIMRYNFDDKNSIITESPVTSLILKVMMTRSDDDIFGQVSLASHTDVVRVADKEYGVPGSIESRIRLLGEDNRPCVPIVGTLSILDPDTGSMGLADSVYRVNVPDTGTTELRLPFAGIQRPHKKTTTEVSGKLKYTTTLQETSEWLHILVNGEEWTHATQPLADYPVITENFDTIPKVYILGLEPIEE